MEMNKKDIIQWDVKNWGQALDFWQPYLTDKKKGEALSLGERHGGLTLWLAQQGWKVVCTDLNGVSEEAHALHQKYNIAEKVSYESANITQLPYEDNRFDVVVFKSVLGALQHKDNQLKALQEIHRVLKPGGHLLFAENLVAGKMHQKLREKYVSWNSYWRYLNLATDMDLFAHFNEFNYQTHGVLGLLGRNEAQRNFLGGLDRVVSKMSSSKSHYILIGACKK